MATLQPLTTGSVVQSPQGHDATFTGLSTNIVIRVGGNAVGAIKTITITEERTISMIDEVGTDGHIDSAPSRSTNITGSCERTRFDLMRISEAFSRDFLHVAAQRIPFDIDIYDNWNGAGANSVITTIRNVWIKNMRYSYQSQDWIIIDSMDFEAERIYSTLNGGPAATGGLQGYVLQQNPTEVLADTGQLLGSMSIPGLASDYFTNA